MCGEAGHAGEAWGRSRSSWTDSRVGRRGAPRSGRRRDPSSGCVPQKWPRQSWSPTECQCDRCPVGTLLGLCLRPAGEDTDEEPPICKDAMPGGVVKIPTSTRLGQGSLLPSHPSGRQASSEPGRGSAEGLMLARCVWTAVQAEGEAGQTSGTDAKVRDRGRGVSAEDVRRAGPKGSSRSRAGEDRAPCLWQQLCPPARRQPRQEGAASGSFQTTVLCT